MREEHYTCVNCWRIYPYDPDLRLCPNCGRTLVRSAGGISKSFAITLSLVVMLWVGTPVVVGIVELITEDPRSGYGPDFGVYVVAGLLYGLYAVVGTFAVSITLSRNRPIGTGLLAGTGIGLLLGFITCFSVAGAVS